METLRSITEALLLEECLTTIDLIEMFLHIPISLSHRRFLRLCVGRLHMQFRVLPFSCSTAPRVFSKILISPIVYLRKQGIHIHSYLDDLLIRSRSRSKALQDMETTIHFLQTHGFIVNHQKATWNQLKRLLEANLDHLGVTIDIRANHLFFTLEKTRKIKELAESVIRSIWWCWRN